jgi:hypothetical protein
MTPAILNANDSVHHRQNRRSRSAEYALKQIWLATDFICDKRLKPATPMASIL